MALEIERKFLVNIQEWIKPTDGGVALSQGYLAVEDVAVRVRLAGRVGYLTIKESKSGLARKEFEYPIPGKDARYILDHLCKKPLIEKTRYKITLNGVLWDIDEFAGENSGLIIAEVELKDEKQGIELPSWIGKEVTGDHRYYNAWLAIHPYNTWSD